MVNGRTCADGDVIAGAIDDACDVACDVGPLCSSPESSASESVISSYSTLSTVILVTSDAAKLGSRE